MTALPVKNTHGKIDKKRLYTEEICPDNGLRRKAPQ